MPALGVTPVDKGMLELFVGTSGVVVFGYTGGDVGTLVLPSGAVPGAVPPFMSEAGVGTVMLNPVVTKALVALVVTVVPLPVQVVPGEPGMVTMGGGISIVVPLICTPVVTRPAVTIGEFVGPAQVSQVPVGTAVLLYGAVGAEDGGGGLAVGLVPVEPVGPGPGGPLVEFLGGKGGTQGPGPAQTTGVELGAAPVERPLDGEVPPVGRVPDEKGKVLLKSGNGIELDGGETEDVGAVRAEPDGGVVLLTANDGLGPVDRGGEGNGIGLDGTLIAGGGGNGIGTVGAVDRGGGPIRGVDEKVITLLITVVVPERTVVKTVVPV